MNAEDAIIAKKKKKKAKQVEAMYMHHLEQGPHPKKAKTGEKETEMARKQDRLQDDIPITCP